MAYKKQDDGYYHIPIVDLGTRLRDNFGLRIREHSAFGDGSVGKHAPNSYHYYDEAIDVTDYRDDVIGGVDWKTRTGNLQNLLKGSGAEVIGPNSSDPGHSTHLHLAAKDGLFKLDERQYAHLFGGNAGGKSATFAPLNSETDGGAADTDTVELPDGTSPKTDRQQAVERAQQYKAFTAGDVVKNFGNEFDSMKSSRLGAALAGAQESIIQKRMDSGTNFGGAMVEVEKPVKKDDDED